MAVVQITEQTFQHEVLQAELPTLVDLYADWCQPCKVLEPILDEMSAELAGKLKIVRVDVDQSPMLAQSFRVQSIPMLVLFDKGRPVDQLIGVADKATLMALVKPVLPATATEVSPKDLASMLATSRAVAVDVRDVSAYKRFRIPTAIHVQGDALTPDEARKLIASLGKTPVLYSRSTDEAKDIAERLHGQGMAVAFLAGGFLNWEAEGLEVERGS